MSNHVSIPPIAASDTKHLSMLHHPVPGTSIILPLKQLSTSNSDSTGTGTGTTGTTLWLSSQLLALYFSSLPAPSFHHDRKARSFILDLGSGVGYLPLCLAARGYGVIATDVESVIDSVLSQNIHRGIDEIKRHDPLSSARADVQVLNLDWESVAKTGQLPNCLTGVKVEMVVTSDTIYAPHLLLPLFITLRIISSIQKSPPTVYVGLERRDSALVDRALETAREMGLVMRRVDKGTVDRLMDEAGWTKEDWDDVEIWKGRFTKASLRS